MTFMKYFLILMMFFLVACVETSKSTVLGLTKLKILILKSEKQVNLPLLINMVLHLLKVHLKKYNILYITKHSI